MNKRSEDDEGAENGQNYRFNERPADEVENPKQSSRKYSKEKPEA